MRCRVEFFRRLDDGTEVPHGAVESDSLFPIPAVNDMVAMDGLICTVLNRAFQYSFDTVNNEPLMIVCLGCDSGELEPETADPSRN